MPSIYPTQAASLSKSGAGLNGGGTWHFPPNRLPPGAGRAAFGAGLRLAPRFLGAVGVAITVVELYRLWQSQNPVFPGWTQCWGPCPAPQNKPATHIAAWTTTTGHCAPTSCGTQQYVPPNTWPLANGWAVPANARSIALGAESTLACQPLCTKYVVGAISRPGTGATTLVAVYPATWVAQPAQSRPIPYYPPWTVPPGVVPLGTPMPRPGWDSPPQTANPYQTYGGQPSRTVPPQTAVVPIFPQRPPGPKEKEQKNRSTPKGAKLFSKLIQVTEALDALDAMYEALPEELRKRLKKENGGKELTPQQKWRALYQNWQLLNGDIALRNLLKNQIEDALVGLKSGQLQKFKDKIGLGSSRVLDKALEPFIPGAPSATGLSAKKLDKALDAALDAIAGPASTANLGDAKARVVKMVSLQ